MKIVAFNGSPAGRESATHRMMGAFLQGAARAGAEVENYLLTDYTIQQCRGCFSCWFQTPGECMWQDDMAPLMNAYQAADVVCFGSPVYSWNMTALLKNFVDRLLPLKSPKLQCENERFDMKDSMPRVQQFVAMANCGFPGENNFHIIKAAFSCCKPSLEIYRNCGKLLVSKNPSVQERVAVYLAAIETAGYEMAQEGRVSERTKEQLSMPLMSVEEYLRFLGM